MSQSEFVWCPLIFTAETIVANIYEAIPILLALGLPSGSDGKESACNVGDPDLIPGLGISPGEGNGYPLQCACLGNSIDRGAWWATVHGHRKTQRHGHMDTAEQLTLSLFT